jgi:uncharacterized protein YjiS (DUF1127 family)
MSLNCVARAAVKSAEWVRNTMAFNRELNDLNKMTDRELRDMGLSRCDVIALAKNLRNHPLGL